MTVPGGLLVVTPRSHTPHQRKRWATAANRLRRAAADAPANHDQVGVAVAGLMVSSGCARSAAAVFNDVGVGVWEGRFAASAAGWAVWPDGRIVAPSGGVLSFAAGRWVAGPEPRVW